MDWLKDWWETVVGILLIAVGIGTNLRRIDEEKEWRTGHEKYHDDDPFVRTSVLKEHLEEQRGSCEMQRMHCNKIVAMQFTQGEKEFAAIKDLITDNDVKNEIRHKDSMTAFNEMFKAILGRDRRE